MSDGLIWMIMDDVLRDDLMMMAMTMMMIILLLMMMVIDYSFCCYGDEECPTCEPFMGMLTWSEARYRGSEEGEDR